MENNKKNMVIIVCLVAMILLLLSTLVLKIIELNPKNQEESQTKFVYNFVTKNYLSDKENSLVTDGKYTLSSLYENGGELNFVAEFNIETDKLIHLCITDGTKMLNVNNEDINEEYLKENGAYERSTKTCEFN